MATARSKPSKFYDVEAAGPDDADDDDDGVDSLDIDEHGNLKGLIADTTDSSEDGRDESRPKAEVRVPLVSIRGTENPIMDPAVAGPRRRLRRIVDCSVEAANSGAASRGEPSACVPDGHDPASDSKAGSAAAVGGMPGGGHGPGTRATFGERADAANGSAAQHMADGGASRAGAAAASQRAAGAPADARGPASGGAGAEAPAAPERTAPALSAAAGAAGARGAAAAQESLGEPGGAQAVGESASVPVAWGARASAGVSSGMRAWRQLLEVRASLQDPHLAMLWAQLSLSRGQRQLLEQQQLWLDSCAEPAPEAHEGTLQWLRAAQAQTLMVQRKLEHLVEIQLDPSWQPRPAQQPELWPCARQQQPQLPWRWQPHNPKQPLPLPTQQPQHLHQGQPVQIHTHEIQQPREFQASMQSQHQQREDWQQKYQQQQQTDHTWPAQSAAQRPEQAPEQRTWHAQWQWRHGEPQQPPRPLLQVHEQALPATASAGARLPTLPSGISTAVAPTIPQETVPAPALAPAPQGGVPGEGFHLAAGTPGFATASGRKVALDPARLRAAQALLAADGTEEDHATSIARSGAGTTTVPGMGAAAGTPTASAAVWQGQIGQPQQPPRPLLQVHEQARPATASAGARLAALPSVASTTAVPTIPQETVPAPALAPAPQGGVPGEGFHLATGTPGFATASGQKVALDPARLRAAQALLAADGTEEDHATTIARSGAGTTTVPGMGAAAGTRTASRAVWQGQIGQPQQPPRPLLQVHEQARPATASAGARLAALPSVASTTAVPTTPQETVPAPALAPAPQGGVPGEGFHLAAGTPGFATASGRKVALDPARLRAAQTLLAADGTEEDHATTIARSGAGTTTVPCRGAVAGTPAASAAVWQGQIGQPQQPPRPLLQVHEQARPATASAGSRLAALPSVASTPVVPTTPQETVPAPALAPAPQGGVPGEGFHLAAGTPGFATASGRKVVLDPARLRAAQALLAADGTEEDHATSMASAAVGTTTVPGMGAAAGAPGGCAAGMASCTATAGWPGAPEPRLQGCTVASGFATADGRGLHLDAAKLQAAQALLADAEGPVATAASAATAPQLATVPAATLAAPPVVTEEATAATTRASSAPRADAGAAPSSGDGDQAEPAAVGAAASLRTAAGRPVELGTTALRRAQLLLAEKGDEDIPGSCADGAAGGVAALAAQGVPFPPAGEGRFGGAVLPSEMISDMQRCGRAEGDQGSLDGAVRKRAAAARQAMGDLLEELNADSCVLESPHQPDARAAAGASNLSNRPVAQLVSTRDAVFAQFRRAVEASPEAPAPEAAEGGLARFGRAWLEHHWRQLALVAALAAQREQPRTPASRESIVTELVRRCRRELAGRCSALHRACVAGGGGLGSLHLVLLCASVAPASAGAPARAELSDGFYSVSVELDARSQIRAGRTVHVCGGTVEGLPECGCHPLEQPAAACLRVPPNAWRPASSGCRLGPQRRPFPAARLADVRPGGGDVPLVDVVVLRVLPCTYRSFGVRGGTAAAERTSSQELAHCEALAAGALSGAEAAVRELAGAGADEAAQVALAERLRAEAQARVAAEAGSPHLPVLVVDAQAVAGPSPSWWGSVAVLTLRGASEEVGPAPLDRLRVTSAGVARSGAGGLLRLFCGPASRMQHRPRARSSAAPPGLPLAAFLGGPFGASGGPPALGAGGDPPPPRELRGLFCDLAGAPLRGGAAEAGACRGGGWRAFLPLWLLAPGGRLCRVLVEEWAEDAARARGALGRAAAAFGAACADEAALLVQNVTFAWYDPQRQVVNFRARRLHLRLARNPTSLDAQRAMGSLCFSAGELERWRALLESGFPA
ncbi:unnamed protein product [Prorocentrum cordatum]|uniref:BRCA2 OB1 domain-containing protein n=1 Tax=Prorocentrum cordatum TaxID=2364126 RepID=A0ABN9W2S2_9DINO|nr:unnamed protein product [Polarella glacialis]